MARDEVPLSIAAGGDTLIPRTFLARSKEYGHVLMLKDMLCEKGSGPIYHMMQMSYYTVLLNGPPSLLKALADAGPDRYRHEHFLRIQQRGQLPFLALAPHVMPLPIMPEPDSDQEDLLALPPVPLPDAIMQAVRPYHDMRLRLQNGTTLEVKFSFTHSSGNARGWCSCPRHENCSKWRQVNQFRDDVHLAAWLFEWATAVLVDESMTIDNHIWAFSPTDHVVDARVANMSWA